MTTESVPQIHRWRAFAVLAVSFFMTIIDLAIVNTALPTIGRALHFSESNLQWVVTAYAITFGGFSWALWVCGAIALLALPVTAVLLRRTPAPVLPGAERALGGGGDRVAQLR